MNGITFFFDWEITFIEWLQSFSNPFFASLASAFSLLGDELTMVTVLGFIYWCYDKEWGKFVGTNAMCTLIVSPLVKNIAMRRRPYMDHTTVKCLRPVYPGTDINNIKIQGFSLPSMHASNSVSTYGSLALCAKKRWFGIVCSIIIFLIGLSRVYVGVHYPTDVLAGWLIGFAVTALVTFLQRKLKNRLALIAIFAVIALPGWFYCTSNDFFTAYGLMIGIAVANHFEERFVNFKNTRNPIRCVLRIAGGIFLFLVLDEALKLPFSKEFLESGTFLAHFVRSARYIVVAFVLMGIYPIVFKYTAKISKRL